MTVSLTATVPSFSSSKCAKNWPMPTRRVPAIAPSVRPLALPAAPAGFGQFVSTCGPSSGRSIAKRAAPLAARLPFSGEPSTTVLPGVRRRPCSSAR